jgi:DNA-directed RNA polymerase subunit D
MKILQNDRDSIKIRVQTHVPLLNTLRRILLSEIQTFAIDIVHVYRNESALDDNQLAHRIGLVPIREINTDAFELRENCSCSLDCEKCCLHFRLDVLNSSNQNLAVTSSDFTSYHAFSLMENVLLCILPPQGQISLLAKAYLGNGKEHVKWSHVSVPSFYPFPVVSLEEKSEDVSVSSTDLFLLQRGKVKPNFGKDLSHIFNSNGNTIRLSNGKSKSMVGNISVQPHEKDYLFSFQTIGTANAKQNFNKAIVTLRNKLHCLREALMETVNQP